MAPQGIFPLDRLPNELLLAVLQQCDSLSSLWSLVHASKRLRSLFIASPSAVMCAVLRAEPDRIQETVLAVVYVRSRPLLAPALGQTDGRYHLTLPAAHASTDALAHVAPDVLVRLLDLAHRIHLVAHAALDGYHAALVAAAAHTALGVPSEVAALPPSWLEEQQAVLAFWQLQLLVGIASAVLQGRVVPCPAADTADADDNVPPAITILRDILNFELVMTAAEHITGVPAGSRVGSTKFTYGHRHEFDPWRDPVHGPGAYSAILRTIHISRSYMDEEEPDGYLDCERDTSTKSIVSSCFIVLAGEFRVLKALRFIIDGRVPADGTPVVCPIDRDPVKVLVYDLLHEVMEVGRLPELSELSGGKGWPCSPRPRTAQSEARPRQGPLLKVMRQKPEPLQPGDLPVGRMLYVEERLTSNVFGLKHAGRIPGQPFDPFRRLGFMLWDGSRLRSAGFCDWPATKTVDSHRIGDWKRVLGWQWDTPERYLGRMFSRDVAFDDKTLDDVYQEAYPPRVDDA